MTDLCLGRSPVLNPLGLSVSTVLPDTVYRISILDKTPSRGPVSIPVRISFAHKYGPAYRSTVTVMDDWFTRMLRHVFRSFGLYALHVSDLLEDYRRGSGHDVSQFEQKYTEEDFFEMALQIPRGTPLTLPGVREVFPKLSKNHVYKVIAMRKNKVDFFRQIKSKYA